MTQPKLWQMSLCVDGSWPVKFEALAQEIVLVPRYPSSCRISHESRRRCAQQNQVSRASSNRHLEPASGSWCTPPLCDALYRTRTARRADRRPSAWAISSLRGGRIRMSMLFFLLLDSPSLSGQRRHQVVDKVSWTRPSQVSHLIQAWTVAASAHYTSTTPANERPSLPSNSSVAALAPTSRVSPQAEAKGRRRLQPCARSQFSD